MARDVSAPHRKIDDLTEFLDLIVEPTFADFGRNPHSWRHAYLACVATFHAVDRAAHSKRPAALRESWGKQSCEFRIVDMVAHHFKHLRSDHENPRVSLPEGTLPLAKLVFGYEGHEAESLGLDLHNLYFVIRDAIAFVRRQAVGGERGTYC